MAGVWVRHGGAAGIEGGPVGVSPYVQVKGFVKEGVQLVPLALGGPGHHLGELVPGLQGELDKGVARSWWGPDISSRQPQLGWSDTLGWLGGVREPSPPPPIPAHPPLRVQEHPDPAHVWIGHGWLQGVTSPGDLPK